MRRLRVSPSGFVSGLSAPDFARLALQDMEAEEYESAKSETLKQLEEFHASLSRLMARCAETPTPHAALTARLARRLGT